jgi:hypothetical protein
MRNNTEPTKAEDHNLVLETVAASDQPRRSHSGDAHNHESAVVTDQRSDKRVDAAARA